MRIFGSRIDDSKKGRDIDIYIETSDDAGFESMAGFLKDLKLAIGDQRLDFLLQKRGRPLKDSICEYAKTAGIKI